MLQGACDDCVVPNVKIVFDVLSYSLNVKWLSFVHLQRKKLLTYWSSWIADSYHVGPHQNIHSLTS